MDTERTHLETNARETPVVSSIIENLRWRGILCWRENNTPVPIRKGKAVVGFRRFDTFRTGIPDVFALARGTLVGIEAKRPSGGVQSAEQKDWAERLKKAGGVYILARSWEEVETRFRDMGLL